MSDVVYNEKTKLLANALDRASTASITVGVLAPLAAAFLNITGSNPPEPTRFATCFAAYLALGMFPARTSAVCCRGNQVMTEIQILAFIIIPIVVALVGYLMVIYHEREGHSSGGATCCDKLCFIYCCRGQLFFACSSICDN
jgi:hypothetical protein